MGKKSAPPAPDYTAAAEKTAAGNAQQLTQQTYANRADQVTPWGSETWSQSTVNDPTTGQPVTKWTQNTNLDPSLQSSLDSQMAVQNARSQQAQSLIGRMNTEFGQPMDWSSLTPYASGGQAGNLQTTTNAFGYGPQQQNINTSLQGTPQLQNQYDFSNLQQVGNADQTRQAATDAVYKQATSRLDPQWQQQQASMESDLANRGISSNSDAYTRAMADFNRSKNDAYSSALNNAVTQGGQQAQIDYGMNMGLRQQQAGEAQNQGNFYNQAQGNAFGFGNTALQSQLGAQNQAFNQSLQGGQYGLQQQQQAFGQQQQAGAQNFSQQQQAAQFQNQLRQQQLTEAMQKRGFSLNEINALMNGQQVSTPQFAGYNQAQMVNGTDYTGAAQNQYGASMDAYNAQQAGSANTTGAVVGLASAAALAF